MKAAILHKQNEPLEIVELEFPACLEVGQVLVEVHASGICGAQIGEITGAAGPDKYLPHLLGHEGGGIVKKIGKGVRHVYPGDHVVLHWRKGQGIEADTPKYVRKGTSDEYGTSVIGGGPVHTLAEYVIVSENRVTKIPKDVPFDIAALMGCSVTTGLGLINNEAQLKIGQTIAVAGVGGVGLNIVQGAAMVGASRIVAIDIYDFKLGLAKKFGATEALLNTGTPCNMSAYTTTVDVFVDCTGIPEVIEQGYEYVAPGGKMILVGQPKIGDCVALHQMRDNYCGKTLLDSQGGLTNPTIDILRYVELYRKGRLDLDGMITHRLPLEKINEAIELMKTGQTGKCIITMNN